MPTAPQSPHPIPVRKAELLRKEKARRLSAREKRDRKLKWWVTAFLAFVFGLTSVAFFGANPFGNMQNTDNTERPNAPETTQTKLSDQVNYWNNLIAQDPHNPVNYYSLGEEYFKAANFDEAINQYKKALDVDKQYVPALSHLGTAYLMKDQAKEALPILENAASAEKVQVEARKAKGEEGSFEDINIPERLYEANLDLGHGAEARTWLEKAKVIDVLHLHERLLELSVSYFIDKGNKEASLQAMDDAMESGQKIAPAIKDNLYPQIVFRALILGGGMMSSTPMPNSKEKQAKAKEWAKLFAAELMKKDAANGSKIAAMVEQITNPKPPPPKPSGAPAPAASTAPAPAASTAPVPAASTGAASPTMEIPGVTSPSAAPTK